MAQKLIDRNREYAAAGDSSVMSKIRYIKAHGPQGVAQAMATQMIREKFTPAAVTSALKETMYGGKSLAESVGLKAEPKAEGPAPQKVFIAGSGWTTVPGTTSVSEGSYETMLQKIKEGEQARRTLTILGAEARNRPLAEIQGLMKKAQEGTQFEQLIKVQNIVPFKVAPQVETPKPVKGPFELTILSPYEQWKTAATTLPFEQWAKQKGIDISGVDITKAAKTTAEAGGAGGGGGGGRAGEVKLGGGEFGGGGSLLTGSAAGIGPKKDISEIIYPVKFALGAVKLGLTDIGAGEPVFKKTVGEEFWDLDIKKLPSSIYARSITAQKESDIIKENLEGYNNIVNQLNKIKDKQDVLNEQATKINQNAEKINADIKLRVNLLMQVQKDYQDGKITYDNYKSYYDQYKKIYDSYQKDFGDITKQSTDLKKQREGITTQANILMQDKSFKTISDLIQQRGPITTVRREIAE